MSSSSTAAPGPARVSGLTLPRLPVRHKRSRGATRRTCRWPRSAVTGGTGEEPPYAPVVVSLTRLLRGTCLRDWAG